MRTLILQHTAETPVGSTRRWLESQSFPVQVQTLWTNPLLPSPDSFDALVLCGGEMGVHDEREHPWLKEEKKLIETCLKQQKPLVGLCLGGQLLAHVLGAEVRRHHDWEVGWHSVQIEAHNNSPLPSRLSQMVFQFHQDVFELPQGARNLARNDWWVHQAFDFGDLALAFQFHPETEASWAQECALDPQIPRTGRVQTREQIIADTVRFQTSLTEFYFESLSRFLLKKDLRQ